MDSYTPGSASSLNEIRRRVLWHTFVWRPIKLVLPFAILAIIIALGVTHDLPWQSPYQGPFSTNLEPNTLIADFGLQRVSLTRSVLVSTGTAGGATPAILTARLSSDLVESPRVSQFPADQITLTATPVGPSQIEIVAILDPVNPEKVPDGLFTGSISVYTGSTVLSVPVVVYLEPKSGYRALLAFLLLLLGAIFGLSVKWVTEALSTLAAARWRLNALLQALGGPMAQLPTSVADRLQDIRNRIKRQDVSQLDDLFGPLELARGQLREFSDNINSINDDIRSQDRHRRSDLPIGSVVREELRNVKELRSRPWPWPDAKATLDDVKQLGTYVKDANAAIERHDRDVLRLYAEGKFAMAYQESTNPVPRKQEISAVGTQASADKLQPAAQSANPTSNYPMRVRRFPLPEGSGVIHWMTERPRSLAAAASILVVAIVGLQLQYLNSTSFDGSLAEWLSLLLWAAIIELSGVSVLDVVARLSASGSAPRPGRV